MALDVHIQPNSTHPLSKAATKIQSNHATDDTSHFNQSNQTPTAETKTKTETLKIIDQCRLKNQNQNKIQTHPQQQPWYNPVRTEKDTRLLTAQRLLQHYRENKSNTTWYNPVCTEKEIIKQQQLEQQQSQQQNYGYLMYEQVKQEEYQKEQEFCNRQNQHWDAKHYKQMYANGSRRSPDATDASPNVFTANQSSTVIVKSEKQRDSNNNNSNNTWYTQVRTEKVTINIIEGDKKEPTGTPTKHKLQVAQKKEKASRRRKASKIARRKQDEEEQQQYYELKKRLHGGRDPKYIELQHELTVLEQQNPQVKKRWEQQQMEELQQQIDRDRKAERTPQQQEQAIQQQKDQEARVHVGK